MLSKAQGYRGHINVTLQNKSDIPDCIVVVPRSSLAIASKVVVTQLKTPSTIVSKVCIGRKFLSVVRFTK